MTLEEKIEVLDELIKENGLSPYIHKHSWVFHALRQIKDDLIRTNKQDNYKQINIMDKTKVEKVIELTDEIKRLETWLNNLSDMHLGFGMVSFNRVFINPYLYPEFVREELSREEERIRELVRNRIKEIELEIEKL